MQASLFNYDWQVRDGLTDVFAAIFAPNDHKNYRAVTLPHDAMIEEKRDQSVAGANQMGYYPAKTYTYVKNFIAPNEWKDKQVMLCFEGVMSEAKVFINNNYAGGSHYGYGQFYVPLRFLKYGEENTVKVVSVTEERSSRWFSGSGIYRDVYLLEGGNVYFVPESLHVETKSANAKKATLRVSAIVKNVTGQAQSADIAFRILNADKKEVVNACAKTEVDAGKEKQIALTVSLENPALWNEETPLLYTVQADLKAGKMTDSAEDTFGVRKLTLSAKNGLRVNGKEVKLRGACIHHDNGIIGATTLYDAEYYRVKKLKDAGFNAIRSSHAPMSKAMLRVCDELGMFVMDELCDMWNEPKNSADFSRYFPAEWKEQMQKMVNKDFNHPCVVMYSIGNEIPEIGREKGVETNRALARHLRTLDKTRYITNAVSGFLAVADHFGDYTDYMQQYQVFAQEEQQAGEGSEKLNAIMGGAEARMLDIFSVSEILGDCLEPVVKELDVAGYNYLTARHEFEHTIHPDRVVVGSETYPPEIPRLWKIAKRNSHVIGDFSWTGYDYLGEAGIGIYHYQGHTVIQGIYPDRLAYTGDINLNGYRRPVSYLREIAYGLRKDPFIAVCRLEVEGKEYDKNNWKYHDAIDSWTFAGYEGNKTRVLVLSPSEEVELFLNGKSLGKKKVGEIEPLTAIYKVDYEAGELVAVGYTKGKEEGRFTLKTASEPKNIKITAGRNELAADGMSLSILEIDLLDENGVPNRQAVKKVTVKAEGAGKLVGFGSANPSCEGNYFDDTWETFDGRVCAAVRSGTEAGEIKVTVSVEGMSEEVITLPVIPA